MINYFSFKLRALLMLNYYIKLWVYWIGLSLVFFAYSVLLANVLCTDELHFTFALWFRFTFYDRFKLLECTTHNEPFSRAHDSGVIEYGYCTFYYSQLIIIYFSFLFKKTKQKKKQIEKWMKNKQNCNAHWQSIHYMFRKELFIKRIPTYSTLSVGFVRILLP